MSDTTIVTITLFCAVCGAVTQHVLHSKTSTEERYKCLVCNIISFFKVR